MTRVISFLLKDISSLTKFQHDTSSRLCFLLGAREAIERMLSVKEASKYQYLMLNKPEREKSMEKVHKKVTNDLKKQGYEFTEFSHLPNVIAVKIRDRKKELDNVNTSEDIANKYILDEVKHKGLPQVVLQRSAAISTSMGANVNSGDIQTLPDIKQGDEVILMDIHYNIVGYGVSNMSSEEIKRSPGRVAIRTLEGRYDIFKYKENKYYLSGLYSVSTLPRILGKLLLEFQKDTPANILVISQDNGEIAVELYNKAPKGSRVYIIQNNDNHRKALMSTFNRMQVDPSNFEIIRHSIDRYSKSRPRVKFTHFYIEMPCTNTGLRPNPYFELEEKTIISNSRQQFSAIRATSLIGAPKAQIVYVTHSLDPTENEEVIVQVYRQGNYEFGIIPDELYDIYKMGIHALPEIPTVTHAGNINLSKMREEEKYTRSWIGTNPIVHESDAGFVAKLTLKK